MKDRYLIKYEIFCQRKKFSLKDFLLKNATLSYTDIQNYFYNNKTQPPEEIQFDLLKEEIKKDNEVKQEVQKKKVTTKTNQSENKSKEEKKPTPRRRRKRKTNAN
tara:strand:- start:40 stop:354 length:315 start_codon:yes stop_codon:yes gene_type:complete